MIRGAKRSCNPTFPWAGQPDINDILAGYKTFCDGFAKVSATSASAQKAYIDGNNISGMTVDPSNPLTVDFTLTSQASYFPGTLNLSWANPVPEEYLAYLPDSAGPGGPLLLGRPLPGAVLRPQQVDRVRPQPGLEAVQ